MKKFLLAGLALLFTTFAHAANVKGVPADIISTPDGRLQFYPKFSSMTIGNLGSGIKVLDEGTLQGGATWFNFVGSGVTAACVGGTCTITVNGGGGPGGGAGALYVEPHTVSVSTLFFPQDQFVFFNGSGISTVTVNGATGTVSGSRVYTSSQVFRAPVTISSETVGYEVVVGSLNAMGVITSTQGFVMWQSTADALSLGNGNVDAPSLWWGTGNRKNGLYNATAGAADLRYGVNGSDVLFFGSNFTATGLISAGLGTAAAPSYRYGSAADSGIFFDSGLSLGLSARGNRVFTALGGGNASIYFGNLRSSLSSYSSTHFLPAHSDPTRPIIWVGTVSANNVDEGYFYVGRDTAVFHAAISVSSPVYITNSSETIRGIGAGLYIADAGSVSANALETRGSSVATANYILVFATQPTAGQHLIAAQVNGSNVIIAGGGDSSGGSTDLTAVYAGINSTNTAANLYISTAQVYAIALSTTITQNRNDINTSTGTYTSFDNIRAATDAVTNDVQNSSATAYYNSANSSMTALSLSTATLYLLLTTTASELSDNTNTINAVTNPVSWKSLKDVPGGFADGTDDGGAGSGQPTLQSPATGPYSLNAQYGIAASTGIEVGIGLQLTGYMSTASAQTRQLALDTGTLAIALNLATSAVTSADIFGRTYYLHHETTGPFSVYNQIASTPDAGAEIVKTQAITAALGLVKISSFITLNNDPGTNKIPAGSWDFTTWIAADNVLSLDNFIISIATCDFDGSNPSEIVSSTSPNLVSLGVNRYDVSVIQNQDLYISTGHRLIATYSGRTTSVGAVNFSLYYAGSSRASHFDAPLADVYKFSQLQDVPQTYVGSNNKYLALNNDATALVFVTTNTDRLNAVAVDTTNARTEIASSTRAIRSELSLSGSTVANRGEWNLSKSSSDLLNDTQNSSSTLYFQTMNSTMMAVRTDTSTLVSLLKTTSSELSDVTNTINAVTNPVSWNSLKDVPAGFSDGTDDGGAGAGDGKGSPLTVTTGTLAQFDGIPVSSPTTFLIFSSATFQAQLAGASTVYVEVNYASVTAQGDLLTPLSQRTLVAHNEGGATIGGNITSFNLVGINVAGSQIGSSTLSWVVTESPDWGSISSRNISMSNLYGIAASTGIEVGVGLQLTTYMSTMATAQAAIYTGINSTNAAANVHSSTAQVHIQAVELASGTLANQVSVTLTTTNAAIDGKIPNTAGVIFDSMTAKSLTTAGTIYAGTHTWVTQTFSSITANAGTFTSISVGTNTAGLVSISTTPDVKRPLMVISTGPTSLYEFNLTSFTINVSSVYINGVLIVTGTARTDIDITTINYLTTTDGIPRMSMNPPGSELFTSTVPNAAISTMSVTFSSAPYFFVMLTGSPTASAGGDICFTFNNQGAQDGKFTSQYRVSRTTSGANSQAINSVRSSTQSAVAIPIWGRNSGLDDITTSTQRSVTLEIYGNTIGMIKNGNFTGASVSSNTVNGQKENDVVNVTGNFGWVSVNDQITRIDAFFCARTQGNAATNAVGQQILPYSAGTNWALGSRMVVKGSPY